MTKEEELENYSKSEILRVTTALHIPIPIFKGQTLYIWPTYTHLMGCIDVLERRRKGYANIIATFNNIVEEANIQKITATSNGDYQMRQMYGWRDSTGLHWLVSLPAKPQMHPKYGRYVAWSTQLRKNV